ncbi:MAG: enolase C-terminal domain-like protein [Flavobacteriales bacterium]
MSLRISVCPFHLLFKHPFGTAHGTRTGTDSVFVRLEQDGVFGYGEATMPPYVPETQRSVMAALRALDLHGVDLPSGLTDLLTRSQHLVSSDPSARAALVTAAFDLTGKFTDKAVWQLLGVPEPGKAQAMFTIGLCALEDIPSRLAELPVCEVLKVKLDGVLDVERTKAINRLWSRQLFLDVNQGWRIHEDAISLLDAIQSTEVAGIEQPYPKHDRKLNEWLQATGRAIVYADEAVQALPDMDVVAGYGGVNIKLMKCGGLDQAVIMIELADANRQRVMLGSMSESSLGCTAAAHLSGRADLVDLDGPWLLANDPFDGLGLNAGRLVVPNRSGVGSEPIIAMEFTSISA